jgi:hypothetical protein
MVELVGTERGPVIRRWACRLSRAGVRLSGSEGTTRRVAWRGLPAATLLIAHSLVTKRNEKMGVGIT